MSDEDEFRPSLTEFAVSLLEQLEPLSPASMLLSARPLDWGGVAAEEATGPPSELRTTESAESTDADAEPTRNPTRRPSGDIKASLRRNRHRARERRDALYLRAYSQLLEKRLEELQRRRERDAALSDEQRQEQRLQRSRVELWRALATHQRRERGLSEQENARLRALWRSQLEFAAQMQALAAAPRALGPANGHEARVTFCAFDADALATLVRDLDVVYAETSRAVRNLKVPDARVHSVRASDALSSGNIDLVDVVRVPYSFRVLRTWSWDSIISKFVARGGLRVQVSQQQDDSTLLTMKMRYHMTPLELDSRRDGEAQSETHEEDWFFEVVMALRRYVLSPDREMAVWKCLVTGDGGLQGLASCETGYSLMHSSVDDPQATVFKRVRRLEAMAASPVSFATRRLPPTRDGSRDTDEEVVQSAAELFSKLSLSAMEDDVHEALRSFGLE